ncbi:hypothetical protein CYMTET_34334, partial [Cymbomonas tetramitiformis]
HGPLGPGGALALAAAAGAGQISMVPSEEPAEAEKQVSEEAEDGAAEGAPRRQSMRSHSEAGTRRPGEGLGPRRHNSWMERRNEDNFVDEVCLECAIMGQLVIDFFQFEPKRRQRLWVHASVLVMVVLFFAMASQYQYDARGRDSHEPCDQDCGPHTLVEGLTTRFDAEYLQLWGGCDKKAILEEGEWWRWFTSLGVHESFAHMAINMILYVTVVLHLERRYGPLRIAVLFLVSGVGGNIFSTFMEDVCLIVVGASGAIMGIGGLYLADLAVNHSEVRLPILQSSICLVMIIWLAVTGLSQENTSHWSHIGGLFSGLFPAMMFLPRLSPHPLRAPPRGASLDRDEGAVAIANHNLEGEECKLCGYIEMDRNVALRLEQALTSIGVIASGVIFGLLPALFYMGYRSTDHCIDADASGLGYDYDYE